MINEKRTVIVRDVELHWAKLNKAVDSFGDMKWEVQCRVHDKDIADKLKKDMFLNIKSDEDDNGDKYWRFNVQRKLYKAGQDALPEHEREKNSPPEVLNGNRDPITASIGNGSKGNLKLFQAPYDYKGKKGVSTVLTAVQVTELKVYEQNSSVDFDLVDDNIPENAATADF
jgi:hypothetical protein